VLQSDSLPAISFSLDNLEGGGIYLEWMNSMGGKFLASFNLTSLDVHPLETESETNPNSLPEPGTLSLLSLGLTGLLFRNKK
jgi:hypothetical protein